jgi:hypothetical protein
MVKHVMVAAVLALVALPSIGVDAQQQRKASAEEQAFLAYRKEVLRSKRLEDLYFYLDRQTGEFYRSLGTADRAKVYQQLRAQVELFPDVQLIKEDRTATGVTLTFEAMGKDNTKATVMVEILREGSSLKVGPSSWK